MITRLVTETVGETQPELEAVLSEEAEHVGTIFSQLWDFFCSALPSLSFAAVILVCGVLLTKILMKFVKRGIRRSNINPTAASFLLSMISVLLYVLVAVIVLSVLKVPTTSIVTVIGAAGLAVSLAIQDSLSNVAGGFIIMFTKPLKVGDLVQFDGKMGTVESIGILQTKLIQPDKTTLFIPNGLVADAVIVNYSEQDLRRLDLDIGISYSDDVELAKGIIAEIIKQHPLAVKDPEPIIRLGAFGDNAVILHIRVWTANDNYWDLHYDLHEQIKKSFDENGVTFPFSQVDVHFDTVPGPEESNFQKIEKNS